ncbi:hypothetical protein POMI540_0830 [Schizosaccharomyces pombe]
MNDEESHISVLPVMNKQTSLVLQNLKEETENQLKELEKKKSQLHKEEQINLQLVYAINDLRSKTEELKAENEKEDTFLNSFNASGDLTANKKIQLREQSRKLEESLLSYHKKVKEMEKQHRSASSKLELAKLSAQQLQTNVNVLRSQNNPEILQDMISETKDCRSLIAEQLLQSASLLNDFQNDSDRIAKNHSSLIDTSRAHRVSLTNATKNYTHIFDSLLTFTRHDSEDVSTSVERLTSKKIPELEKLFADYCSIEDAFD